MSRCLPKQDENGDVVRNANGTESRKVLLEAILEWNQQHFHQADDTLFAGGAEDTILYDLLGYTGMRKAAKDSMVDGTFMEKYGDKCDLLPAEQVIRELAMPEEIKVLGKKIHSKISDDDFIDGFKKWKETSGALQGDRYRSGPSMADAREVPSKGMGKLCRVSR